MADEFAIVVLDAPLVTGDQDFTDPRISDFRGAMVLISGDYMTEASSAQFMLATFTKDNGSQTSHGYVGGFSRAGATGVGFSRHAASSQTSGANGIRVLDPASGGGNWGLGTISDLSNGFRVNWSDVSGFSSSRKVKLIALLFGGTPIGAEFANGNGAALNGGNPVQMFAFTKSGGFNAFSNHLSIGVGGAVETPDEQALAMLTWPTAADPITGGVYASAAKYGGRINAAAGVVTTADVQECTGFTADGFTKDSTTVGGFFLAFAWEDDRQGFCRLIDLDGTESGDTLLLNLGRHVEVVFACWVGATAEDTLDTSDKSQELGFGLFDGFEAHSISLAIDHGLDPDSASTVGFSRYKANEWNVVSGAGGTLWRVTNLTSTEDGLRGNVVTARAGRLLLWGVSRIPAIEADAVPIPLVLPAPLRLADSVQTPSPVPLPLVVPAPALVFPLAPPSVVLSLVVPAPSVFAPPLLTPEPPPPDFGPLYAETLAALLPRGLAWPKRPLPP